MTPRLRSGQQPSGKSDWETPDDLMAVLRAEFTETGHFSFDAAANHENRKEHIYCGPGGSGAASCISPDGLSAKWYGQVYCNPPYGRDIGKWVKKCWHEVDCGNAELVVALLPVATDTAWWWFVAGATEVRFLKGRVTFVGAAGPAPFASAIVVWRRGMLGWHRVSYWDWKAKA